MPRGHPATNPGEPVLRLALCRLAVVVAMCGGVAQAATVQYVYDELGRLVAAIDPAGDTTFYIYDAAGNLLSVSRDSSGQFRVDAFSPASGKAGDTVTIFGAGFIASPAQNTVSFNGATAAISLATAHSLVVSVPPGATTGSITVSNVNGSATTAQAFTVIAPATIAGTTPGHVSRGQTSRVDIAGTNLDSATAVNFSQPGIAARIASREPNLLRIDLTVAGNVPFGAYGFSVTNYAGTSQSGAVSVTVTAALLGDVVAVTRPLSVHLPAAIPNVPAGNAVSVAQPLSVHLPALIAGVPPGNAMSVAQPVSVHLPAEIPGVPAGNAVSVAQPVSVSMP